MIVVDTSVWISALRSPGSPEAPILAGLLDSDDVLLPAPVRTELLSGVSVKDRPALKRALTALPILYPTDDTWKAIDEWTAKASASGVRLAVGDLLIAAMAHDAGALVWSLDADFERMERLGFIHTYGA